MAWTTIRQNADGSVLQIDTATGKSRTTRGAEPPRFLVPTPYQDPSKGGNVNVPRGLQGPSIGTNFIGPIRSAQGAVIESGTRYSPSPRQSQQQPQQQQQPRQSQQQQQPQRDQQNNSAPARRSFNEVVPQRSGMNFSSLLQSFKPTPVPSPRQSFQMSEPMQSFQTQAPMQSFQTSAQGGARFGTQGFSQQLKNNAGGFSSQLGQNYSTNSTNRLGTPTPRRTNVTGEDSLGDLRGNSGPQYAAPNRNIGSYQKGLQGDINKFNENINTQNDTSGLFDDPALQNDFLILDANAKEQTDILREMWDQGRLSEEQAIEARNQIEIDRLTGAYDKINQIAESEIPGINNESEKALARVREGLVKVKTSAGEVQQDVTDTFGGQVRRIYENSQAGQNRLKNVYSALGSVESSDFLDRLGSIEKTAGQSAADTERELGRRTSNIGTQVIDAETSAQRTEKDIIDNRDALIRETRNKQDLNGLQKVEQISAIIQNSMNAMNDIRNQYNNNLAGVYQTEQSALISRGNILAEGQVNSDLLNQQFDLQNQQFDEFTPNVPDDLSNELGRFMIAPSSGYNSQLKANQLKSKYPQWADVIDGVYSGQIKNMNEVKSLMSQTPQNQSQSSLPLLQ